MKLIAKKPCSFRGEKFYIGDEIPAEFVLSPKDQEKMGVLAIVNEETKSGGITIMVRAEEGDVELNISAEGMQAIFDALGGSADEAKATIEGMTDTQALLLLNLSDGRKSIKAAAEARAKALSGEEAGEQ